jgi:hypothetical protein
VDIQADEQGWSTGGRRTRSASPVGLECSGTLRLERWDRIGFDELGLLRLDGVGRTEYEVSSILQTGEAEC